MLNTRKWIREQYKSFYNVRFASHYRYFTDNETYVLITGTFPSHVESGLALCSQQDTFDIEVGIAIAFARLCQEEIPKEVLNLPKKINFCDLYKNDTFSYKGKNYKKMSEDTAYCYDTDSSVDFIANTKVKKY